jgi:hypothetical protein
MKLIYLAGSMLALIPSHAGTHYAQSNVVERDHVEVIYLPNNTCHISVPVVVPVTEYKDYVRACLNNRHLRLKINHHLPN